jgi:hypothetical protein
MLTAINKLNIRRYVVQSGALLFPSMNPDLGVANHDGVKACRCRAMEHLVRASDIDWTMVRPPQPKHGVQAVGYRTKAGGRSSDK